MTEKIQRVLSKQKNEQQAALKVPEIAKMSSFKTSDKVSSKAEIIKQRDPLKTPTGATNRWVNRHRCYSRAPGHDLTIVYYSKGTESAGMNLIIGLIRATRQSSGDCGAFWVQEVNVARWFPCRPGDQQTNGHSSSWWLTHEINQSKL